MKQIGFQIAFRFFGLLVATVIQFLILEFLDRVDVVNLYPEKSGWLAVFPMLAGLAGLWFGLSARRTEKASAWLLQNKFCRLAMVLSVAWGVIWTLFCNLSEDFGGYGGWSDSDWFSYLGFLVAIPLGAFFVIIGIRWALNGASSAR